MAKFTTNSTGTTAIRLSEIIHLTISTSYSGDPVNISGYQLRIKTTSTIEPYVIFEIGNTLQEVQNLAAPILAALEA